MRALAVVVAALLLWLPSLAATGAWTDSVTVAPPSASDAPPQTISTRGLDGVSLTCAEETVPLLVDAAKVSWTPVTSPTTLTYTARIVQSGANVPVSGNSSATVLPGLFGAGLFGQTVTLRVTGTLGTTGWSVSNDRTVFVGLLGAYVNCTS